MPNWPRRIVSTEARAAFREHHQRLADHFTDSALSSVFAATVARLDAGEPIVIRGWQLGQGYGLDYSDYCLEADGRVTPVEPVFAKTAKVRTVANYVRPDGSLVTWSPRGPLSPSGKLPRPRSC